MRLRRGSTAVLGPDGVVRTDRQAASGEVGLGYKGLNSDKTDYVFNTSLTVNSSYQKTVILFIDLGPISTSSFQSLYMGEITLTLTKNEQKAVFTYTGLQDAPSSSIS